jgi:ATP-dependent Lhr-like helicase
MLGTMPVNRPLVPGAYIIFAGRRWQVVSISQQELVIEVKPGAGGTLPRFDSGAGAVIHTRVREEMRAVLAGQDLIPFLDAKAAALLDEARQTYRDLGLAEIDIRQSGNETQLLLWQGDRVNDTVILMMHERGFQGMNEGVCINFFGTDTVAVRAALGELITAGEFDNARLAATVQNKIREKWDSLLPDDVLAANYASQYLDMNAACAAVRSVLLRPEPED